jgi:hypothetical protein
MSTVSRPFGLRPVRTVGGNFGNTYLQIGAIPYAYGTSLYQNQPVTLNTSGQVIAATATTTIIGSFQGVQYTPVNGRPVDSNFWPANTILQTGAVMNVFYTNDPNIIYEVQSAGSVAQTAIGDQADMSNFTANDGMGNSQATLSASLAGAGSNAQFRILDVGLQPDNEWGDTFTIVQVQIAEHPYVATIAAV